MSTQIASAAMSSSAPPTMAPAREMPSAISCSRFIAAGGAARLLDRRPEAQRLAHGVVPLAGALDAAALRPAGEDGRLDELLVLLGLGGLDRNDRHVGKLAHGAGLLAGIAVVRLGGRLLQRRPHLVLVGLELRKHEVLDALVEPVPAVQVCSQYIDAPAERHRIEGLG